MIIIRKLNILIFGLILLIALLVISLVMLPILKIISIFNNKISHSITQTIIKKFANVILKILSVKVEIIGEEKLPNEPCLYVANHRSIFDVFVVIEFLREQSFFVAKHELRKIPIGKYWLKLLDTLLMNRSDMKQSIKIIVSAIDKVKNNMSCFIFPEGTRSNKSNHEMLPFKEGSFKIATKTGACICPIALLNTGEIYENNGNKLRNANVKVIVCDTIRLNELNEEELKHIGAYTQEIIRKNIEKYSENII